MRRLRSTRGPPAPRRKAVPGATAAHGSRALRREDRKPSDPGCPAAPATAICPTAIHPRPPRHASAGHAPTCLVVHFDRRAARRSHRRDDRATLAHEAADLLLRHEHPELHRPCHAPRRPAAEDELMRDLLHGFLRRQRGERGHLARPDVHRHLLAAGDLLPEADLRAAVGCHLWRRVPGQVSSVGQVSRVLIRVESVECCWVSGVGVQGAGHGSAGVGKVQVRSAGCRIACRDCRGVGMLQRCRCDE